MVKEVLLIFKTHLDVGFTGFAQDVLQKYIEEYIPKAIDLGYQLRDTDTPFIWTTGSWLIYKALQHDTSGRLEQAIRDGLIRWHGLPFTTQTELMNESLFRIGLSVSRTLDERFGVQTTGAKMTDVPGHTIGMVPLMADAGIRFLHIGVNPATPNPDVPDLFCWKCGDKSIMVLYNGDYGKSYEIDDLAIVFGHTGDNCGPQSPEQIVEFYQTVQEKYPEAHIQAATLNTVAEALEKRALSLPVVEQDIGDTWIYGAAADPWTISAFRELSRYIEQEQITDITLSENLLMVPEHTWGMDVKTFFPDTSDWSIDAFETNWKDVPKRKAIEASWEEQRNYVREAAKLLQYDLTAKTTEPPYRTQDLQSGTQLCPVEISWQLYDVRDYERFRQQYIQLDADWAIWDLTKKGLPDYPGKTLCAKQTDAWTDGDRQLFRLEFADAAEYGLPVFFVEVQGEQITVKWFGKKASRYPQAFWLKFLGLREQWQVHKMGQWLHPEDIIDGSLLCGIDRGVRNDELEILSLDAALAAPFGRHLLEYGIATPQQDLYFNLYNNVWNTNYPMWYDDDAVFRFVVNRMQ